MDYLFDNWDNLKEDLTNRHIFLFLDYDGTLTPIVESPDKAVISEEARNLLKGLSTMPGCDVGIISGRALKDIKRMVGLEDIIYAGNHGLEIEVPKIRFESQISPESLSIMRDVKERLSIGLSGTEGIFVEDKEIILSIHYRLASQSSYLLAKKMIEEIIQPFLVRGKIKVSYGKRVMEIKPPVEWDKGRAVEWILGQVLKEKPILPIYLGDDVTDEDVFVALKDKGLTIYIGKPRESQARYYLRDTREVFEFLEKVLGLCQN
ncbi:MAG: trehalose-phosphatase [bacterium]